MSGTMVDINCDMGESFGPYKLGDDDAVLPWVTSINVACGFHGGDPRVIEHTVRAAAEHGVGVGAHPGFPDLVGFGRRDIKMSRDEARTDTLYQMGAVAAFTRAAGIPLHHVKPHGQLNNLAMTDPGLADGIVAAIRQYDFSLILIAYGGLLTVVGREEGLTVANEVYADREYHPDGSLVPRGEAGAVIHDIDRIVARAVQMVLEGTVRASDGETIKVRADTICVHGDTPGAAGIARALRTGLEAAGVAVRPLAQVLEARSGESVGVVE